MPRKCDAVLVDCHTTYECSVEHGRLPNPGKRRVHRAGVWFHNQPDGAKAAVEIRWSDPIPEDTP